MVKCDVILNPPHCKILATLVPCSHPKMPTLHLYTLLRTPTERVKAFVDFYHFLRKFGKKNSYKNIIEYRGAIVFYTLTKHGTFLPKAERSWRLSKIHFSHVQHGIPRHRYSVESADRPIFGVRAKRTE